MILVDTPHFFPNGPRHLPNAQWCHMTSDTSLEELHSFAAKLGMRRSWFQDGRRPHYDLTKTKRDQAVRLGAREVSARDLLKAALRLSGAKGGAA